MRRLSLALRLLLCALALALFSGSALAVETDAGVPRRILVVYENESILPAIREVAEGFLDTLAARVPYDLEIYSENMDAVRFPTEEDRARFTSSLIAKYAGRPPDVIVAMGPAALNLMLEHRGDIAPGAPIVFGGVGGRSAETARGHPDVGGLVSRFDTFSTIELARQLQPDARRIVVLTGSSEFDRTWAETAREELQSLEADIPIDHLTGLSIEGFQSAVSDLSADTILLVLTVFADETGRRFIARDAADAIVPASGAPAYAVYSSYIGTGIVGGFMETFESIGAQTAELAAQVLLGEVETPPTILATGVPVVDWRQLRRWRIEEARLPAGTELRFFEPTLWERYRWQIVAIAAIVALQTATIAALLAEGRRRRRIRDELALERLELARLSRISQLGQLSGALAHELRQPLTSILANAEAGSRLMDEGDATRDEVKEILDDIIADDKRAAAIISQLRQMMAKGEIELRPLDLNDAVASTIELAHSELVARKAKVDFVREQPELTVRGSLAQLQQIVLNLLLNAADAVADLAPSQRHILVETRMRKDGCRELAITDHGPGLSPEMRADMFKPFVTTKPNGLGLGLAICRSIAQSHGGTLSYDDDWNYGARIVLALPAP